MGVIPNPKIAFIFQISYILTLIFQILLKYFTKGEGKGSYLKSQIKSLRIPVQHICCKNIFAQTLNLVKQPVKVMLKPICIATETSLNI